MFKTLQSIKCYASILLIPLILVTFLKIEITNCDHLSQKTDEKKKESSSDTSTGHVQQQQQADPEYIKKELKDLIRTKVDADKDGSVSYEELKNYLADLHEKSIEYNVDKQWNLYSPQIHEVFSWEGYEPERKEVLTWDHYFNQTYPDLIGVDIGIPITREQDTSRILPQTESPVKGQEEEKSNKEEEEEEDPNLKLLKVMVYRADARWKLADENGDTLLTKPEFKHLLHPDEGHEELQNLFVREATEDMDLNQDGKICLDEFMKHLQVLASDQERNDQNWLSSQQENFGRFLDKNKDGVLDGEEIRDWLVPSKSKKFAAEAKRLMDIGDANEDHKLTGVEILENYEDYLSLLPPDYWRNLSELYELESSHSEETTESSENNEHDEL